MSRFPVDGRSAGGYDQSLLQIAPQITRADRQQGYSVDILEQGGQPNYQHGPNAPRRQPIVQGYEQHRFQQSQYLQQPSYSYDRSAPPPFEKANYYSSSSSTSHQQDIFAITPYKPKKPWFRTKRGLGILFVVLLVLAGAVVGIVLGVSAMNKANANKQSAQLGNGGVEPSGAQSGGAAGTNALPSLPSLSLVTLATAQQAAAGSPADRALSLTAPAAAGPTATPPAQAPPTK